MQRLISELRRLFLLPDIPPWDTRPLEQGFQDDPLRRQFAGQEPAALPLLDEQGRTRLMVVGFHGVSQGQGALHCSAMLRLGKALMEELGLPEPVLSVSGHEGFDLWLSLAEPVPATEAGEFLGLLKEAYLQGLPAVTLWPAPECPSASSRERSLPPARHPATGLWSVFVTPGLAGSFVEEAGIDVPPNLDKQAELLAQREPMAPELLRQALQTLRQRQAGTRPVPLPGSGVPAATPVPRPHAEPAPTMAPASPGGAENTARSGLPGALADQRTPLFRALAATGPAVVDTPFPGLSRLLHGGFRAGRLYALLAPPKSGKTTLAASWLDHAAANGHPALYVGYEMAREQLVHAALARRLRLDARCIEAGALTAQEAERVAATLDAYLAREGRCLAIWEAGPATGLADIEAWVKAASAVLPGHTPLVVIDPLLLAGAGLPAPERVPGATGRAATLAAACKDLARRSGAAVIALGTPCRPLETEIDRSDEPEVQALLCAADGVLVLQARMPALQDAAAAEASRPARVRLQLLAHRGRLGEVALHHWRAFHLLEETASPGLADAEAAAGADDAALQVFRRHADGLSREA